MSNTILDSQRQRWNLGTKVVSLSILGFVVAPFIFIAIQGLVGLLVTASIILGVNFFIPVIADKVANLRINMIKAAAAKDPIPTLQRDYGKKMDALASFRESIKNFAAAVLTFKDKLDSLKEKFPDQAEKFVEQLAQMKELLELRKQRFIEASNSLQKYNHEIDKAKALWDMAQEASKMNAAAGMSEGDFLDKIRTDTALDAVTMSMNSAFAELEGALLTDKTEKKVTRLTEGQSSVVIDEARLFKGEKVKVKRS